MNSEENARLKKKSRIKRGVCIVLCVLTVLLCGELFRSNYVISTEEFVYESELVPESFDGFKILQISDFHNQSKSYCDRLVKKASEQKPDCIFITGDVCDFQRTDVEDAEYFLESVSKIAPCYLVWGNHDYNLSDEDFEKVRSCALKNGITVLEGDFVTLEKDGESILVVGTSSDINSESSLEMLKELPEKSGLTLWLNHYPESFEEIVRTSESYNNKADLIFSGHAHGGLVKIPFIDKGLIAPGQGLFAKYIDGLYKYDDAKMIVSRGVGNSGYTKRLLNSFQLTVCTLKSEK